MGLFRPYEPAKPAETATQAHPVEPVPSASAGRTKGASSAAAASTSSPPLTEAASGRPVRKSVPTPSRREAEAARRQRLNPVRTKKEAKAYQREQQAKARQRAMAATESRPEMVLMRDYVDARWNVAEFMLPVMITMLALSMVGNVWPPLVVITMVATWVLLAAVLLDLTIMWRGFKKVLAERYPNSSPKGLMMMAANRAMMMRRFRNPPARIKRGESY